MLLIYNLIKTILDRKIKNLIFLCITLFVILLLDHRGAVFSIILALSLLCVKISYQREKLYIYLAIILIMIIFYAIDLSNIDEVISRDTSGMTFSNREIIWASILLVSGASVFGDVFGYGAYGHVLSGATDFYEVAFRGVDNIEGVFAHNSYLQIFIDSGYLGLFISCFFLLVILNKFSKYWKLKGDSDYLAAYLIVIYIFVLGFTEVVISFYQPILALIYISLFSIILKNNNNQNIDY